MLEGEWETVGGVNESGAHREYACPHAVSEAVLSDTFAPAKVIDAPVTPDLVDHI